MANAARLQQLLRGPPPPPPTSPLRPLGRTGGAVDKWKSLEEQGFGGRSVLFDSQDSAREATYTKNIENYIGTVKVPIGLAGPLRIKEGSFAKGDFFVPLATTEAALVASVSRGVRSIVFASYCARSYLMMLMRTYGFMLSLGYVLALNCAFTNVCVISDARDPRSGRLQHSVRR